jgi:hypothetical protein
LLPSPPLPPSLAILSIVGRRSELGGGHPFGQKKTHRRHILPPTISKIILFRKKITKNRLFFTHFRKMPTLFFTHFTLCHAFSPKNKTSCSLKTNHFFPLLFFARAKKAYFITLAPHPTLHPALVRKRSFLVIGKKCVNKIYFVFNEQIVIINGSKRHV